MFIGGQHNTCVFGRLRVWAERGLIHIEDASDNTYDVLSVKTALRRMLAINEMLANSRAEMIATKAMHADEYDRQMRMLEQMTDVCRRAQIQGMPSDPTARRDCKRRLPKTVSVPGTNFVM